MNKKNILFFIIMVLILSIGVMCFVGCGKESSESNNKKEYSVDAEALASEIVSKVKFASEMSKVDAEFLDVYFTIEEGVTGVSYKAGGSLADEITIFTAPNKITAKKMLESVNSYIDERKELFAGYAPAEVTKLEKAVAVQKGKYVVFCVTDNIDEAKTIIDNAF